MYKVYYYQTGSSHVSSKAFDSFREAMEFSMNLPRESVLEIKKYDNETNNTKNEPHFTR